MNRAFHKAVHMLIVFPYEMIPGIEMGPQYNNVAFGEKDTTQETSTRGQDGEDLHSHHGLPLGAQVGGHKGDPNAAKHHHAESDKLGFIETIRQIPSLESYCETKEGQETHVRQGSVKYGD